jgi:hypothetical protein
VGDYEHPPPVMFVEPGGTAKELASLYYIPSNEEKGTSERLSMEEHARVVLRQVQPAVDLLRSLGFKVRIRSNASTPLPEVFRRVADDPPAPAASSPAWTGRADFEERKEAHRGGRCTGAGSGPTLRAGGQEPPGGRAADPRRPSFGGTASSGYRALRSAHAQEH